MVISQNKYQIQIPHAIWTLEWHWYYAINTVISQLTFIRNPPPSPYTCVYMHITTNRTSNKYRNQNVITDSDSP